MKTFEEQKAFVEKFNIMDDTFFQKVMESPKACEEMLRTLLQKPGLLVVKVQTQRFLRNMGAHSVVLDLLCREADGAYINVEMQKSGGDDYERRMRFNQANVDTTFVERGTAYKDFPDVYIIMLSKSDIFAQRQTIYHIDRVIRETGAVTDNGVHEIYVNAAVDDGSDIAQMMQYFKKSVGMNPKFPQISKQVEYYKSKQEGVADMCDIVEEYAAKRVAEATRELEKKVEDVARELEKRVEDVAQEMEKKIEDAARERANTTARENAFSLLKNGVSLDIIKKSIPSLTEEDLKELEALANAANS